MKKLLKVSLFVVSVFIVVACTGEKSTPEKTAKAVTSATINGDVDTVISLIDTREFRKIGMDRVKPGLIKMVKEGSAEMKATGVTSDTIEISDVEYSNDKRTADLIIHYPNTRKSAQKMTLVKFDDKWHVQLK